MVFQEQNTADVLTLTLSCVFPALAMDPNANVCGYRRGYHHGAKSHQQE